MKKSAKIFWAAAMSTGLVVGGVMSPAIAATNTTNFGSKVCSPAYRAAEYLASVGQLSLFLSAAGSGTQDTWQNATRTTRVKLSPFGVPSMDWGIGTYQNGSSNKGQDCRFI